MEKHSQEISDSTQNFLAGQLTVTIKCARDLPAVDNGGTSDPYVITRLETPNGKSEKMKTRGNIAQLTFQPLNDFV